MSRPIASKIYNVYGRFYGLGEMLFRRRIGRALSAVRFREGQRVLDVGVGTGLSLEFFPPEVHVTGLDLSPGMLQQARRKIERKTVRAECPPGATELIEGDALALPFTDNCFHIVLLSHVITTVPDPVRCLREAVRVAREGGTIVLVNHFRNAWPVINWLETAMDPICRRLGWRSDLSMEELLGPAGVADVADVGRARDSKGFIFRVLYLQKGREGARVISPPALGKSKSALGTV